MNSDKSISLQVISPDALEALRANDLSCASRIMNLELPAFFLREGWLWEIRLEQVRRSPGDAPWLVRAAVLEPDRVVVGHAGFHGPPDTTGVVEIGYTIVPEHRAKGYSHLVLSALLSQAVASHVVTTVRATVSPDNLPSLKVVTAAQFRHVGEQWDEADGAELVFEKHLQSRPVADRRRPPPGGPP
jgi:[ribosomal protein S5]-alanine N-acetyltransferase